MFGISRPDWDTRLFDLGPQLLEAFQDTVIIVVIAYLVSVTTGSLLGLALYTTRAGGLYANRAVYWVLNLIVNFFRPIPFIIFIVAVTPLARGVVGTGFGIKAAIFGISLAATFFIGRVVEQNLFSIDPGVIEAARAMGASRIRIVVTVLIPEALGTLILGYTFAFVALVDASALVGAVGANSLGPFAIRYGHQQWDPIVTWTAVLIIVVIVQIGQLIGNILARKVLRR